MRRRVQVAALCGALIAMALAGCGSDGKEGKPASQVTVKVNKEEISVHQLNEVLARAGNVPPEQVKAATAAALERLVDQELMVQQANDRKLEREPQVMRALENARREILARAYAEQVAGFGPRPTDDQIGAFYAANPGLFSQRRIYNLQQINVRIAPERFDELRLQADRAPNLQAVADWLRQQEIPFAVDAGIKPAEQLPIEILGGLLQMNQGQLAVSRVPGGALLLAVAGYREEPIDEAKARPFIEQYLLNQSRSELAKNEVKRLREVATIEYVGDFKPVALQQDAPPAAVAVRAPAPAAQPDPARSAIEKGATSLK